MMDNQPPLPSPDGSSNRNPPERCPRPLYSRDPTQEDLTIPHQDQHENHMDMKIEVKEEEEETNVRGGQQSTEVGVMETIKQEESSLDGSSNRNPPERCPRSRYSRDSMKEELDEEYDVIKELSEGYKDIVMEPPSNRNPPERCPRPLYSRDPTQEDLTIPHHHQGGTRKRGRPRTRPHPEDDPAERTSRQVAPSGVTSPPARTPSRPPLLPPTASPSQSSIVAAEQARGSSVDGTGRLRHHKFSSQQNMALVELYIQHHPRLHGAMAYRTTGAQKKSLWQEMISAVNAEGKHPRTLKQVQKRVCDIIRRTKEHLSKLRCSRGPIPPHLLNRLRPFQRLMVPLITSETVFGVDDRDDTDDWLGAHGESDSPQGESQLDNSDMDVAHDPSMPGPSPDASKQEQSYDLLQDWLQEDTEHHTPLEAEAVGLHDQASNDGASSGNSPSPPVCVPKGRATLDAGGSVQTRAQSRLYDITERVHAHCDRVVEQDQPDNPNNDLSQVVQLLHAPLQSFTEALGTFTESQGSLATAIGSLRETQGAMITVLGTLTASQGSLAQTLGNLGEMMRLQREAITQINVEREALRQELQYTKDLLATEVYNHRVTRQQLSALVPQQVAGSSRALVNTNAQPLALQQNHYMAGQNTQAAQPLAVAAAAAPQRTDTFSPPTSTHPFTQLKAPPSPPTSAPLHSPPTFTPCPSPPPPGCQFTLPNHASHVTSPPPAYQFTPPPLGYHLPPSGPASHLQSTHPGISHSTSNPSQHTTPAMNPTHPPT